MIFRYLSKRDLQDVIGRDLLERLEGLAPILFPEAADPTFLYKKNTLLKVLFSFKASQLMKDKSFLEKLLNSLPAEKLEEISNVTGVGTNSKTFQERLDKILKKGWREREYCETFIRQANLPETFLPAARHDLLPKEVVTPSIKPFKRLKIYQYNIYSKAMEQLSVPLSRFVMHMPTGSGKTRTSMELIVDTLNAARENGVVIWIAHSEELCEQSIQCFREVWSHIGSSRVTIYRGYGSSWELPSPHSGKAFVVGGFQKLYSLLKKNDAVFFGIKERVQLVVVDEAHKATAPTYKKVTKALIGSQTRLIGLTATPGRSVEDDEANQDLSQLFFSQVIGIETPNNESVFDYLRREKVLAHVVMERLITSRTYEMTTAHKKRLEQEFDFPGDFLKRVGDDDIRNIEIIKRIRQECDLDKKILFFACSIEHSQFVCALLSFSGIQAAHIDGSSDRNERAEKIDSFKNGRLQVLCNYGVLSTGFDAPNTDVVFISRPTKSIVLYSQMIGRGLRGPAIGGTANCKVINVIDNIVGLPSDDSIYDYFEEYWTD